VACGASFQYSPLTWDVLPLVEFELEGGISDDEAQVSVRAWGGTARLPGFVVG
jgi:hypothetical protein